MCLDAYMMHYLRATPLAILFIYDLLQGPKHEGLCRNKVEKCNKKESEIASTEQIKESNTNVYMYT